MRKIVREYVTDDDGKKNEIADKRLDGYIPDQPYPLHPTINCEVSASHLDFVSLSFG